MKKIIAILITLVLLVTPITSFAEAPEAASFLEGPATVEAGKEVEITYYLQGDNILAADGKIDFKSMYLEIKEVKLLASDWILEYEYESVSNGMLFALANESGKRPISEKTAMFQITFEASSEKGFEAISASFQRVANGSSEMKALENTKYVNPNAKEEEITSSEVTSSESQEEESEEQEEQGGITVVPPVVNGPSDDFTLKSLKVNGYEIRQKGTDNTEFDPEVKNYELTVPFSLDKLEVEAVANDEKATVEITETELIYVGTNITKIVVTAENGSKRTYKIYTTRLAPEKDDANANDGATNGLGYWLYVIIGAGVLLLLIIVIIIIIILKKKKNNN